MSDTTPTLWRPVLRQRLFGVAAIFLLWSAGIEARLVYLQVYRHDDYVARAESQQSRTVEIPAPRGDVLDRNGRVLAWSVPADSAFIVPNEVDEADRARVVTALCGALDSCDAPFRSSLAEKLKKKKAFAWVRRQITPDEKRRIDALGIKAVGYMKETRRFYPNAAVAAHALGYVSLDGAGLGGVELSYNRFISGTPGKALVQSDARHEVFSRTERPPTPGATVELTIDKALQFIVERELKAGVALHRAQGGTAIVMDPWTGEILAMANEPTFNPNAVTLAEPITLRNRAIEDTYEPGSTFKTVTASAALEEGIVKPEDPFDTSPGYIRIGSSRIVRDTHPHGVLSFTDVIVKSSNVGAIKVGFKLGGERLARFVRRFGFGQRLLPDLRGESPGIVWREFSDSALASVSMGYQVGVTALQMASAVSSVANGGRLMEPHLVRAVAVRRPAHGSAAQGAPGDDQRRDGGHAHHDHGSRRGARDGQDGADRGVHDRGQDGHGREARGRPVLEAEVQLVVRRVLSVAQAAVHGNRRHRFPVDRGVLRRLRRGARVQEDRRGPRSAGRRGPLVRRDAHAPRAAPRREPGPHDSAGASRRAARQRRRRRRPAAGRPRPERARGAAPARGPGPPPARVGQRHRRRATPRGRDASGRDARLHAEARPRAA